jgi:4-hydroxy-tetrahydrodipicolinate synthase
MGGRDEKQEAEMLNLRGAFTALVTPLKDDFSVDYDGWRRLIEFQLKSGIDGLVPLGTTGETPTLDDAEEETLIKIIVEVVKGKVPVIVGAGSNSTSTMEGYAKRARDLGADAILISTPYYNKPNDSGLIRHFEAAAAAGLPVVIYNIPGRTGRNIPITLMKELMKIPGIAAVKEASGDITQIGDTIAHAKAARPDFAVISGDDGLTLPVMALGGTGVVSVVSNLYPQKVKALTQAVQRGEWIEAQNIHFELLPFFKAAFIETNPVPIKAAMNLKGMKVGPCRLPLGPLAAENAAALKKVVEALSACS